MNDYYDDYEEKIRIDLINDAIRRLNFYIIERKKHRYSKNKFRQICTDCANVLYVWCTRTYIAERKEPDVESSFQRYYENLFMLIFDLKNNISNVSEEEKIFATKVSYTGVIYRMLGNCSLGSDEFVEPEYNDIYVSWSKNENVPYVRQKIKSNITKLKYKISDIDFGFDVKGFEECLYDIFDVVISIGRGEEREVIYPTVKGIIVEYEKR